MWWLYRPDAVSVWDNKEVRRRLDWYYKVLNNKKLAKFLLCSRIEIPKNYKDLRLKDLLRIHTELDKYFYETWYAYRKNKDNSIEKEEIKNPSFLDLKIEISKRILKKCIFCERRCRVNRYRELGHCRVGIYPRVSSWFLHLGEESFFVPSGTIFFSGCNFNCVYCQNWDISQNIVGEEVNAYRLYLIQKELKIEGARNINWVGGDPTPNIHAILESLKYMVKENINIAQLWNSNFYLSKISLFLLLHVTDIWLPDFKYGNNKCAKRYSNVENYFEIITRNLNILSKRKENTVIRHLILPNHVKCCSKPILDWISKYCKNSIVNVMDQYHPDYLVLKTDKYKEINRRITFEEYKTVLNYAKSLNIFVMD